MSKATDEQTTPRWFFDIVNGVFKFTLDAAATKENTLCPAYYDKESNGLKNPWNESTWCNPPYSRGEIIRFLVKAAIERDDELHNSVLLIPADTSTKWFRYAYDTANGIFAYAKRLKFNGCKDSAKFGSLLVLYGYGKSEREELTKVLYGYNLL